MAKLFKKSAISIEKIEKICEKYNYISFDVFDTLIKRNVSSSFEVWKIIGEMIEKELNLSDFCVIREEVQRELVRNNPYTTLHDIYVKISENYGNETILRYESIEKDIEKNIVTANSEIKEIYRYCVLKGKKIAAISDMYLDKNTIRTMLEKAEYDIDNIFISCEEGAGKHDGKLYHIVKNKLNWKSKKWLHIGDSYKADVIGAKKAAIDTIHIRRNITRVLNNSKKVVNKRAYDNCKALINNELPNLSTFYEKFGFAVIGPLIYGFVSWLLDELTKKNISNVYFFSRDGYLIKKAFDELKHSKINSHYIYFSRRAMRIPYLSNHNTFEEVIAQLPPTKMYTTRIFLESIGLDAKRYKSVCESLGIELDEMVLLQDIKIQNKYRELFEVVKPDMITNAKEELVLIKRYIEQEGIKNNDAIVDIGWNNSMQYYLENLDHSILTNLYGYYIGVSPIAKKVSNSNGFIKDSSLDNSVTSVSGFVGLVESLFLAQEGSTKRYKVSGQKIIPVLLDYEYKTGDIEYKAFKEIQHGALKYVKKVECIGLPCYRMDGYDSFIPLKNFGLNPDYRDIDEFGDFRYLSEGVTRFASPKTILYYLLNVKEFKADLYAARWKIAFMKKLFRVPLPYDKIYRIARGERC